VGCQGLGGVDGHAADAEQVIVGDGRRAAAARGGEEGGPGGLVAFILAERRAGLFGAPAGGDAQGAEVIEHGDRAAAEDLDALLGDGLIAVGQVGQGAERAVGEAEGEHGVILAVASAVGQGGGLDPGGRLADEEGEEVDEVAAFADDAPAADGRVVDPVAEREEAGVDAVVGGERLGAALEGGAQRTGEGGEAAVEADREQARPALGQLGLDLIQLGEGEGERFFAVDVLSGAQPGQGLAGVLVVAGEQGEQVDLGGGEQVFFARGGEGEAVFLGGVARAEPGGGDDAGQAGAARGLDGGQEDGAGVAARAQDADGQRTGGGGGAGGGQVDAAGGGRGRVGGRGGVGEQHAEEGLFAAGGDDGVGFGGFGDGEAVADQGAHIELAGGEQVDDGLQVAAFGPAHVAGRVVEAALFVGGVVAAGAVGARDLEIELFVVVEGARDVEADGADGDDTAAVAGEQASQLDGVVGAGVGADQDDIEAGALAEGQPGGFGLAAQGAGDAQGAGQLETGGGEIDAKDGAAGGARHLGGEQAEQAEADDGDALAELGRGQAQAVEGDGAEGGEGGLLEFERVGQAGEQVARDAGVFGVDGEAAAGAGDALAELEAIHAFAELDDGAGGGVAEGHGLVEAVEGGLQGGQDAFAAGFVEDLADEVGARAGFAEQAFFGEFDDHALGTGGDERGGGAHEGEPAPRAGAGDFGYDGLAVTHVLEELFHAGGFLS